MKRIPGWVGWVGLAAYVLGWDLHPRTETLSHSFAPEGTHGRKVALALWIYITAHLVRLIPDNYDPLRSFDLSKRGAQ